MFGNTTPVLTARALVRYVNKELQQAKNIARHCYSKFANVIEFPFSSASIITHRLK
jgi:hypothetical protein